MGNIYTKSERLKEIGYKMEKDNISQTLIIDAILLASSNKELYNLMETWFSERSILEKYELILKIKKLVKVLNKL